MQKIQPTTAPAFATEPVASIHLTSEWTKAPYARAVPGAYFHEGAWRVPVEPISPRTAAILLKLFPATVIEHQWLAALRPAGDLRPQDFATPYVEQHGAATFPQVESILDAKGWSLHDYQRTDLTYLRAFIAAHHGGHIAWCMGLGKTLAACALIEGLSANYNLIITPNSAKRTTWEPALAEFTPWLPTFVLPNAKAKREAMIDELTGRQEPYNLVVHYEALPIVAGNEETPSGNWKPGDGWKRLGAFDLVVCDESHRLKNQKTRHYKALAKIDCVDRLALSGTPMLNALEDIWGQLAWLFPKHYTAKWRQFNDRFLDYVDVIGKVCIGPKEGADAELRAELGRFMTYRRSSDVLDLPAATTRELLVDLSAKQRKAYEELIAQLRTTLEDEDETTLYREEGLSLLSALRQVATGLDLLGEVSDSTKLDVADELIKDAVAQGEVVFVAGWYKRSLDALAERLGDDCYVVHGDKTQKQRDDAVNAFMAGGKPVLLATISTLKESVNLQRASQVITLDRSWVPAENEQLVARVVRQGQTNHVQVTHIVARDTVDQLNVNPTLLAKSQLINLIFGGK